MTWRISTLKIDFWLWRNRASTWLTWISSSQLYRLWLETHLFKTLDSPYHSIRSCNRHSHGTYILSFCSTRLLSIAFYCFLLHLLSFQVCRFANTPSVLVSSELPKPTMIWHVCIICFFNCLLSLPLHLLSSLVCRFANTPLVLVSLEMPKPTTNLAYMYIIIHFFRVSPLLSLVLIKSLLYFHASIHMDMENRKRIRIP